MVGDLNPQRGNGGAVEQRKAFFQLIADLRQAVAQLAFETQPAREGARPQKFKQPDSAQDDHKHHPNAFGPEQLDEDEERNQKRRRAQFLFDVDSSGFHSKRSTSTTILPPGCPNLENGDIARGIC